MSENTTKGGSPPKYEWTPRGPENVLPRELKPCFLCGTPTAGRFEGVIPCCDQCHETPRAALKAAEIAGGGSRWGALVRKALEAKAADAAVPEGGDAPYGFSDADIAAIRRAAAFYEGEFYMLSNFSSFRVVYRSRIWPTAEHAYQAMKFHSYDIQEMIRHQDSAHAAKKGARAIADKVRGDWDEVKVDIMREICRAKLEQHPYIREKLMGTGDRPIFEASPEDAFWGWGPDRRGQNMLGRIWVQLRSELRAGLIGGGAA